MKQILKISVVLLFCLVAEVNAAESGGAGSVTPSAGKEPEEKIKCGERQSLCTDKVTAWCCGENLVCGQNKPGLECRPPSAKKPPQK